MNNEKTIIALLCIIIAILIIGVLMFSPLMAKEDSKLTISDKKLYKGDPLTVKLTDLNGTPITNETVNIKLTDKDGITIDENVTTDAKGKAKIKIEETGKYTAECSFDGNNKYSPNSTSGEITVKKIKTKVGSSKKTTSTSKYAPDGSIYPEFGPAVDTQGVTREYAIAHNWNYIEMIVDGDAPGEYVNVSSYVPYDPAAGCWHT